jgi:hypothetical protein
VTEAFTARDDARQVTRVSTLLRSPEHHVRAAAYAGLAVNGRPTSTSQLIADYLREPDAELRRALVRALRGRPQGSERDRVLSLARRTDPDPAVRALATSQHGPSGELGAPKIGHEAAWFALEPADPARKADAAAPLVGVSLGFGRALITRVPADGLLVILGLSGDDAELRLGSPPKGHSSESAKSD